MYQYSLEHQTSTCYQLHYVFSEIISSAYIYDKLINNKPDVTSFIYGIDAFDFVEEILCTLLAENPSKELKLNAYKHSIDEFEIIGSINDVKISNEKEIKGAITNSINEAKILSDSDNVIVLLQINYDKTKSISFIITDNVKINRVDVEKYLLELRKIKTMGYGKKGKVSVIGCINQAKKSEAVIESLCKIGVSEDNNEPEEVKEIDVSSMLSGSLMNNQNLSSIEGQQTTSNIESQSQTSLKNEIALLKQEKSQLEQMVKLLETSLRMERSEKLTLINENSILREKLLKTGKVNQI